MLIALKRGQEQFLVRIGRRHVPVVVRRNARAARLILRIDETVGLPVLTLPANTSLAKGEDFVMRHREWLESRFSRLAPPVPFLDGSVFPLRGKPCRIIHRGGRGLAELYRSDGEYQLFVPGERVFLPRRVTEWLKHEARCDLEEAVGRHAATVRRKVTAIRVSDPKSRWGSCSSKGVLTFSWRLVLAPRNVLDYLAAHETAHLRQMNHGPRFWAWVERLDPDYEVARAWLKREGSSLSAVGRNF